MFTITWGTAEGMETCNVSKQLGSEDITTSCPGSGWGLVLLKECFKFSSVMLSISNIKIQGGLFLN